MSKFKTPVGTLSYVYVSGQGSAKYGKDKSSTNPLDFEFKASMKVDKTTANKIQATINAFWKDNKPAKVAKPTTTFLKAEMIDGNEKDEYGEAVKVESGMYLVNASTNAAFADRANPGQTKPANIALLNSKGVKFPESHPLSKGTVGVGEGSKGIIHGTLAITEYEGKAYVKFYLAGVQFSKFVAYEGNSLDADEIDSEEDDGCGIETDGCDVENIAEPEVKL